MKVKDYTEFRMCKYNSTSVIISSNDEATKITFGDIVARTTTDGTEIGIVIQVHNRFEFRVDMFGNTDVDECRIATLGEIIAHRPKLIAEGKVIEIEFAIGDTVKLDRYNHIDDIETVKIIGYGEMSLSKTLTYKVGVTDVFCETTGISIVESIYYKPAPAHERHYRKGASVQEIEEYWDRIKGK
tara:strand:+ start:1202 stop:1756 length:555 start_codon:yes stop_codon:yes gene_type:complete